MKSIDYKVLDKLYRETEGGPAFHEYLAHLEKTGAEICADRQVTRPVEEISEPLEVYLREIARVPALTLQRERDLVENGELAAKRELVEANLSLVVAIAGEYLREEQGILDLIERGNYGLFRAVDSFQPGHGYRFATYAMFWVHRELA